MEVIMSSRPTKRDFYKHMEARFGSEFKSQEVKNVVKKLEEAQYSIIIGSSTAQNLETSKNEIPAFSLMLKKLKLSLERDKKIIRFISKNYRKIKKTRFLFKVKLSRNKYIKMIKNRYISTLLGLSPSEISKGINEINRKYQKLLIFNDKLICLILEK